MRLRHPCPLPLSVWQSEIAIGNRDGIRPNRLNPIVLPWQSRWNRRFDRIIGNTVLICIQYINRPIDELYIQPLSPPDARTVLLPESDNCHTYTPATHRPNDRACTPTINRLTGRQALCLTTIITVAGTVLPPGQTAAMLAADSDLTVAALPAAYRYFTAPACS